MYDESGSPPIEFEWERRSRGVRRDDKEGARDDDGARSGGGGGPGEMDLGEVDLGEDLSIEISHKDGHGLKYSRTINPRRVRTITRLFHRTISDGGGDSDDSVDTTKFTDLAKVGDETGVGSDYSESGDGEEAGGDIGGLEISGESVSGDNSDSTQKLENIAGSFNPDITLDSKDSDSFESIDSAFTDIDSSVLDSLESSFEFKARKKPFALNSKTASVPFISGNKLPKAEAEAANTGVNPAPKSSTLVFAKVDPVVAAPASTLTSLMHSRAKSANPLACFSFVADNPRVKVDVFVPPRTRPTLIGLEINNTVSVFDCIGFILLQLSKKDQKQHQQETPELFEPNHWRLELVDEDGENYGSFGVLDRTRLFSSYNNPREIAVCHISDVNEITHNEIQTPLAPEFRQAPKSDGPGDLGDTEPKLFVQLTIVLPNHKEIVSDYDPNVSVRQILTDICIDHDLPGKYRMELEKTTDNDILTLKHSEFDVTYKTVVDNEYVKDLASTRLIITRSSDTESDSGHETPGPKPEPRKGIYQNLRNHQQLRKASDSTIDAYLVPVMNPTNNARYFTWKVWRKKTTIINKLEKSLIIDGDYIRLQPPEDRAYTKNPDDNPFLHSSSHHHRHLHHYNYANYYNSSMMKTSSFHITQIVKLKQYKNTKNPNHFKIVVKKQGKDNTTIKKKYDLEAVDAVECQDIVDKIKWVMATYTLSRTFGGAPA